MAHVPRWRLLSFYDTSSTNYFFITDFINSKYCKTIFYLNVNAYIKIIDIIHLKKLYLIMLIRDNRQNNYRRNVIFLITYISR